MRRYTVVQLTEELTQVIGDRYPLLEVEAEVSQLSVPASGHAYMTLAERDAVLAAVVWRSTWSALAYQPRRGDKIIARGKLGVYAGKGAWQLYVHTISRAGEGDLAAEIARRRARLEAEGLLDPRRKRRLPTIPRFVGVATSLTGAALQDFLKVSRERFPAAQVLVAGCLVQGPNAPASVIAAVDLLLEDGRAELIVVTRGGGSKEDLLAFQDEGLARHLAHCPVPVVSAVGHQVDTTLCDLVADAVAPTPTGAAVLALPDRGALAQQVDALGARLDRAMAELIRRQRARVDHLARRVRHPGERLAHVRTRTDALLQRLIHRVRARLDGARRRVVAAEDRGHAAIVRRVERARLRAAGLQDRLLPASRRLVERRRARLATAAGRLEALSPQRVLERGYAVVTGPAGVLTDPAQVAAGDALTIRVAGGLLAATAAGERPSTEG